MREGGEPLLLVFQYVTFPPIYEKNVDFLFGQDIAVSYRLHEHLKSIKI